MTQIQPTEDSLPRTQTAEAAETLCDRLMEYTGEMITVLERETALLRSGRPHEIAALSARKTALSTTLTRDMAVFRRDAEFIREAAPGRLETIKEQHQQLKSSLAANQDALTAMKAISESMLQTIAARVNEQSGGPAVYGKDASMQNAPATRGNAISYDQSL